MTHSLPIIEPEESFAKVTHQGKTLNVGDTVFVQHSGTKKEVQISSILKRSGHYWVGYENNQHYCPWPLVQLK